MNVSKEQIEASLNNIELFLVFGSGSGITGFWALLLGAKTLSLIMFLICLPSLFLYARERCGLLREIEHNERLI